MAQKVISYVVYNDDLTGEEFAEGHGETLSYGLDGAVYEIDLTEANAKELREFLSRYTTVSRKIVGSRGRVLAAGQALAKGPGTGIRGPDKKPRRGRAEMAKIREWGKANGYTVPEPGQGRVPEELTKAYDRAMTEEN